MLTRFLVLTLCLSCLSSSSFFSEKNPRSLASRKLLLKVSGFPGPGETAGEVEGCRAPLRLG